MEFCFVIDHSPQAYTAVLLALVAPTVMFAAGAWFIREMDVSGPYAPMVAAVAQSLTEVLLCVTVIVQVKFALIAAEQYRKAKTRLGL